MDEGRLIFAKCVVKYVDQGYDSRQVLEMCAKEMEGRFSEEEMRSQTRKKVRGERL